MEERNIPFIAHESQMSRLERIQTRIWVLALILIGLLVGSNALWIIHFIK